MGIREAAVAIILLAAIAYASAPAAATSPVVENVSWDPWVPARGENVTVEADVSDPDGLVYVSAAWCVLPPFTCIIYDMADTEADGRWTTDRGVLVVPPPWHGAYFNVTAIDSNGNIGFSPYYFVQFGDAIVVDATASPTSVPPGSDVTVSGTALYAHVADTGLQANASAPAMDSSVDIQVLETGATRSTTTDGAGAFTLTFPAPMNIGSYTLEVTVSNRTITGSQERYLVVSTVPTPDLAIVAGSLSVNPSPVLAGDPVTISFTIENRGDAAADGFSVRLTIEDASGAEVFTRAFDGLSLAGGQTRTLSASWTATAGARTVRAIVDPADQVQELSESNNDASSSLIVEAPPSGGVPTTLIVGLALLGVGVAAVAVLAYRRRARSS